MGTFTSPQPIGTAIDWIDIAAGDDHTCAMNVARNVYCWGQNSQGQLGLGDMTDRPDPTLVTGI